MRLELDGGRALAAVGLLLSFASIPVAAGQGSPVTVPALRRDAEQFRVAGRFPEALAAYQRLVELDSATFEDRFWLAKIEGWTNRLEAADSLLVRLLAEQPGDYDSRMALADVRMWRGQYTAARVLLDDLHRTHPTDPEVLRRLERLRRAPAARWEVDAEYFGQRIAGQPATNGVTLSVGAQPAGRLRWRGAVTLQDKFRQTEARAGTELSYRVEPTLLLQVSAGVAPGADVLPRLSSGVGLAQKVARPLVFYADYVFFHYRDADVHDISPGLELYAGRHWMLGARYHYTSTGFNDAGVVGNHGVSAVLGYLYGLGGQVRGFVGTGAESFTGPSRDVIGDFEARTVGCAWRHSLTSRFGFEVTYAHQERSDGVALNSYSLRVIQQW